MEDDNGLEDESDTEQDNFQNNNEYMNDIEELDPEEAQNDGIQIDLPTAP